MKNTLRAAAFLLLAATALPLLTGFAEPEYDVPYVPTPPELENTSALKPAANKL